MTETMKNTYFLTISAIFLLLCACPATAEKAEISLLPLGFHVPVGLEGYRSPAYAAVQDRYGYVWIGTETGLLKYDGFHVHTYKFIPGDPNTLCNNHVSALLYCPDTEQMIVGTDTGLSVYDFTTDSFSTVKACGYRQVKTLFMDNDTLYVGTAEGLDRFVLPEGKASAEMHPDSTVAIDDYVACAGKIGNSMFFGGYDCFYRYGGGESDKFLLGTERKLVLAVTGDREDSSRLWLGTEQGLLTYDMDDGSSETVIENIPVKYFFRDRDGRLWICTDNGLFINDGTDTMQYKREVENSNSLPDNVIWSVSYGTGDNIFICTDAGLTMPRIFSDRVFRSITSFTGSREGLDIKVMETGSNGNLYMGGMNGLVAGYRDGRDGRSGRWYRSDSGSSDRRLSHNKIRDLYDDGTGLIVLSDGGLDRLDYRTGGIRHYNILDASGEHYSTWMYSIAEDNKGRLWIGTYNGLLMIKDKNRLIAAPEVPYKADRQFCMSSDPSISGNAVIDVVAADSFVAALSNGAVDFISFTDDRITYVELPQDLFATTLEADGDSIWVGTSRGLYILGKDGNARAVPGFGLPVNDIVKDRNKVIVVSEKSVYIHDTSSGDWKYCPFENIPLFCGAAGTSETLYVGSANGLFEVDTERLSDTPPHPRVSATALLIDNVMVRTGHEYNGHVILPATLEETKEVTLKHNQNSFAIEYSTFDFSGRKERFVYRLAGFDNSWQTTSDYRTVFINIPGGKYRFEAAVATADGGEPVEVYSLPIRIRTVWYATPFAYLLYVLVLAVLCAGVFYYLRMRHQLQIEHIERDKALKMADMKTEFLANVSHEFKSPLSIILGFTGRMISSESDSLRTRELHTIQKNAEKIHLLLNQMVEFNESRSLSLFIPTATSLPEMVREVYDRYSAAFAEKGIASKFVADNIDYIFMTDRVKMESAIQNLLSNALKFTQRGGSVLVSVSAEDTGGDMIYADIRVEDTGCGIGSEELPYIFKRFYRAQNGQKENVSGSGIGLALVKQVVEMHKGTVRVESEPGKGSVFTIRLSTMKADSFILKSADNEEEYSLHNLSNVWQHERKPIILIVEDNHDIRDFITASLGKDYVFLTADEGQQALDLLEKEKTDLVVTDISMPGMDGLSMCRVIRNTVKTAFLPIIVLTGKNDAGTEMKSFEYADAFITKPFSLSHLNTRIIQLLIKHELHLAKIRQQKMLEQSVIEVQSFDEKLLQEVVEIVTRHLEDPGFSASALCEESRYGSKQIYRKVKQLTGMSIVEFIRDMRLRKAALYLEQGKLSVTEVMYKVGFTTASYFSKCFKEKFGSSPSEYKGGDMTQ